MSLADLLSPNPKPWLNVKVNNVDANDVNANNINLSGSSTFGGPIIVNSSNDNSTFGGPIVVNEIAKTSIINATNNTGTPALQLQSLDSTPSSYLNALQINNGTGPFAMKLLNQNTTNTCAIWVDGNFYVQTFSPSPISLAPNGVNALVANYDSPGVSHVVIQNLQLPTIGGIATNLNYYEEYSQTNTFSGPWGATTYDRLVRITRIGNTVTIKIDGINQGSSTTATISSLQLIPARFRPIVSIDGTNFAQACILLDKSITVLGSFTVTNGGGIFMEYLNNSGPFPLAFGNSSGLGNAGFPDLTITYIVA